MGLVAGGAASIIQQNIKEEKWLSAVFLSHQFLPSRDLEEAELMINEVSTLFGSISAQ